MLPVGVNANNPPRQNRRGVRFLSGKPGGGAVPSTHFTNLLH
jgi:hypothetical protein